MAIVDEWQAAQAWEKNWWLNNPQMHAYEITKGDAVAKFLQIGDVSDKSVIDIGCGPFSLLQRHKVRAGVALDPLDYQHLEAAYAAAGISRLRIKGEDLTEHYGHFDEAWIYNCLQHVVGPGLILRNAIDVADCVRLFEWINMPPCQGHPHMLTLPMLCRPFEEAGWKRDLLVNAVADFNGLNGPFCVGIWRRPA
jgi:hypothetical protein